MKKSLGLLSRAALIGMTIAVTAAPVALAAAPAAPPQGAEQPATETPAQQVAKFTETATKVEADAKAALAAAEKAGNPTEAKAAKEKATAVKTAAAKLEKDVQAFLTANPAGTTHDDRVKATQALTKAQEAVKTADKAIKIADGKITKPTEPPVGKSEIFVVPSTVARGELIGVAVFCAKGEGGNFQSDAIDFVAESFIKDGPNVFAIGGLVKKTTAPGTHTVTATCGSEKLSGTFTVTSAVVDGKKPTADDVRRKKVIRHKGKVETGGGATAQLTV